MLSLLWTLSVALRGCLSLYLPSNRAVDWLRASPGLKWALPVALTLAPAYLFAASVCATVVDRGGPGHLNVLVLLFFWNAVKFAVVGALAPHQVFRSLSPASTNRAATVPDTVRRRPRTMHQVRERWFGSLLVGGVNDGRKLTPFRRLKVDPLGL